MCVNGADQGLCVVHHNYFSLYFFTCFFVSIFFGVKQFKTYIPNKQKKITKIKTKRLPIVCISFPIFFITQNYLKGISSLFFMFTLPLDQLKEKVVSEAKISQDELNDRIKKKMEELAGLISEQGAAHIVAHDLGIQLFTGSTVLKLGNLSAGTRNVETLGKVMRIFDVRNFQTERGAGKVGSFMFADDTGSMRVVLWNDQAAKLEQLKEGDVVKVKSGYVRSNNFGSLELHLNDRSQILINPEGEKVIVNVQVPSVQRKSLHELHENDTNVEVMFTIVDVFDLRFFSVCPQCNKRVFESNGAFMCNTHQAVTPMFSYVLNVIGDDGTDTMRIVLWKEQSRQLLGMDDVSILTYKDYPERFQDVKHKMLGETVKMVGRVSKNTMFDRLEFQAQSVTLASERDLQQLEKTEAQ